MDEKPKREKKLKNHIPEEAREHYHTARRELREGVEALMPEGFQEFHEHRKTARKEMLLAFRSLLDSAIKRMDEPEE